MAKTLQQRRRVRRNVSDRKLTFITNFIRPISEFHQARIQRKRVTRYVRVIFNGFFFFGLLVPMCTSVPVRFVECETTDMYIKCPQNYYVNIANPTLI